MLQCNASRHVFDPGDAHCACGAFDVVLSGQKPAPRPPKVFHNSKWAGEGIGGFGDYRVVVRSPRSGAHFDGHYVQILDDSDGMGMSFTRSQTGTLIELLQTARQRSGEV